MNKDEVIEKAAEIAYGAYMEAMATDPRAIRDEVEEKAKYIMNQILKLKDE